MSNTRHATFKSSALCTTGRHLLCPARIRCDCSCHKPMTIVHAQSVILRLAGVRLWPDERDAQQQLVDRARERDPLAADYTRAVAVLGLVP